jgi:hypothetical protein
MGVVIYKRVVNVYDIPNDIMVQCIGQGLRVNRDGPFPMLEVWPGRGLRFDPEGKLNVHVGEGLCHDCDDLPAVKTGRGIGLGKDREVEVRPGFGLGFDADGNLTTLADDPTPDPSKSECYTVMVGSDLSIDAQKLKLTKTFQDVALLKNSAGFVVGREVVREYTRCDDVIIAVPYGYGYGGDCGPKPYRNSTPESPNFYGN